MFYQVYSSNYLQHLQDCAWICSFWCIVETPPVKIDYFCIYNFLLDNNVHRVFIAGVIWHMTRDYFHLKVMFMTLNFALKPQHKIDYPYNLPYCIVSFPIFVTCDHVQYFCTVFICLNVFEYCWLLNIDLNNTCQIHRITY